VRALSRNVWDADQMFFCPKYANGTMFCPSIPELPYPLSTYYTEVCAPRSVTWSDLCCFQCMFLTILTLPASTGRRVAVPMVGAWPP